MATSKRQLSPSGAGKNADMPDYQGLDEAANSSLSSPKSPGGNICSDIPSVPLEPV